MRLSLLSAIITLSSLGLVTAQPELSEIVAKLNTLSNKCMELMPIANKLSVLNAPLLGISNSGPWVSILEGFESIDAIVLEFNNYLADAGPLVLRFTGADASYVTAASGAYAAAQKQLLDTLASKGGTGLFSAAPVVGPRVRDGLEPVDVIVNAVMRRIGEMLAFGLRGGVEADTEAVGKGFKIAREAFPY